MLSKHTISQQFFNATNTRTRKRHTNTAIGRSKKIAPWFIKSLWFLFTMLIWDVFGVRMNVWSSWWCMAMHIGIADDFGCDCDAFKLHFFLDCCFVLFVRLSNGYAHALSPWWSQVRRIFVYSMPWELDGYKNEERPLLLFILRRFLIFFFTFVKLHFILHSQQVYSKPVSFYKIFLFFMRSPDSQSDQTRLLKMLREQYASDRINWFAGFVCFEMQFAFIFTTTAKKKEFVPSCWCNLCLSLCCHCSHIEGKNCPGNKYYKC